MTTTRCLVVEGACRLDAACLRHREVHEHDVGLFLEGGVDASASVPCRPADLNVVDGREQPRHAGSEGGAVVDEQNADHGW